MSKLCVHGEMKTEDGYVGQFRYDIDCEYPIDAIPTIEGRFMPGSKVLWIMGGFVPADKTGREMWTMEEESKQSEESDPFASLDAITQKISSILS